MPLQLLAILGAGVKHKHKHKVFASGQSLLGLQHCSRPAHADTHFVSDRVKTCRLRRGQMLDKVKAKLQASVLTCKLSGAQGQAAPWMTSEQRSKSSMTASIYRQAVHPCHDRLRQCM